MNTHEKVKMELNKINISNEEAKDMLNVNYDFISRNLINFLSDKETKILFIECKKLLKCQRKEKEFIVSNNAIKILCKYKLLDNKHKKLNQFIWENKDKKLFDRVFNEFHALFKINVLK